MAVPDELRERLIFLGDELPDEVASASWLRDGRDRWMVELQQAREPSELAQCALQLEKCIKRRAQPKWWRHERPIWVQGLLALARSSQAIEGCEPERLLHQLVLTLGKLVRTLDLCALGVGSTAVDASRKRAEELGEVLRADESAEVVHGDAPVCDFFLQRKRRRVQPGDMLLPPAAVRRLQRLARAPATEVLADLVLDEPVDLAPGEPGANASVWARLLSARLSVVHGGIGTLAVPGRGDCAAPYARPAVECAPDSLRLMLDEATGEVPGHLLRAICHAALRELGREEGIAVFEVSIEEAILSCPMPGYEARVRCKRLLDLPKVRARLDAPEGGYASLYEFRHDMRDMLQSAIEYHAPRAGRAARSAAAGGARPWIASLAAMLHAQLERTLPRIIEELQPRTGSYLCPSDALPRPWAVLELAHAAQRLSASGFLRDLPATVIGEMREACMGILQVVQKEVAERLRQGPTPG